MHSIALSSFFNWSKIKPGHITCTWLVNSKIVSPCDCNRDKIAAASFKSCLFLHWSRCRASVTQRHFALLTATCTRHVPLCLYVGSKNAQTHCETLPTSRAKRLMNRSGKRASVTWKASENPETQTSNPNTKVPTECVLRTFSESCRGLQSLQC